MRAKNGAASVEVRLLVVNPDERARRLLAIGRLDHADGAARNPLAR